MILAMGEIEALARKAAKGAGFGWGEAEEAAQAARIVAASGLPACGSLAAFLSARERGGLASENCPVTLGCQLMDGRDLRNVTCHAPLLFMGFVARRAAIEGHALTLYSAAFHASAGPDLAVELHKSSEEVHQATLGPALEAPQVARVYRSAVSPGDMATLLTFAQRTYAPETEARRNAGAGAGNDGNA